MQGYQRTHCDKGHVLELFLESYYFKEYGAGCVCDGCAKEILCKGEKHGHCRLCRADYCEKCMNQNIEDLLDKDLVKMLNSEPNAPETHFDGLSQ